MNCIRSSLTQREEGIFELLAFTIQIVNDSYNKIVENFYSDEGIIKFVIFIFNYIFISGKRRGRLMHGGAIP